METIAIVGLLSAFVIYFAVMIAVGFIYKNKNKSTGDYLLGGRKLNHFVSAMSAEASDMSGWLLLGLPGVAYLTGMSSAGWTAIGLAIGTYLNWKLVAKRLRIFTHKAKDSITIPEFFKNRFADKKAGYIGIGVICAVLHNAGQLAAAVVILDSSVLSLAAPLLAAGAATGVVTGTVLKLTNPVLIRQTEFINNGNTVNKE